MPAEVNKIWAVEDDSVRDWSALHADALGYLSKILSPVIEDITAFRGVCTSWRAAATKDTLKVPLLMLPEKGGSNVREFYSLSERKICMRLRLPDAAGKRCMDAGFGWILTVAPSGEVCLLKPFSGASIKLPNIETFPEYEAINPVFHFITQAVLTANPSDETSNFTVLIATARARVGFWRNGGDKWERINPMAIAMVYCRGEMHTLELVTGHVSTWDPTDLTEPQGRVRVNNAPTHLHGNRRHYLVRSTEGELLLIERNNTGDPEYLSKGADHFGVMRIDLVKGELTKISDLGKDAIILGDNAVAVDATEFPGVLKPNCIYFADDCHETYYYSDWVANALRPKGHHRGSREGHHYKGSRGRYNKGGGKDMGIYNVKDQSIERFKIGRLNLQSFSLVCPPLWVFPSF